MTSTIHYQSNIQERFIPISLECLINDLSDSSLLDQQQQWLFKQFCTIYTTLFHAQSHQQLSALKTLYQPFNPDKDVLISSASEQNTSIDALKAALFKVLEKANYERISEVDLNEALNKTSPHGVRVSVDFNDFSEVALFYRGSAVEVKWLRNFRKSLFKKQATDVLIYRRLFVLIQPKSREQWLDYYQNAKKLPLKKAEKQADKALQNFNGQTSNHVVYLKLFKDIPRADLEMQFPNTRVKMRLFDKIKLWVTGGGGTAGGVMATLSKFSATIDPLSAAIAVAGLLGVIWRQIAKIFSQRAKYSATLTKNLYFYSLDNNMGALTYLSDSAEAEDCKEAILAYFFLIAEGDSERVVLDKRIEQYIKQQYDITMNFEIDDGLYKLNQAGLIDYATDVIQVQGLSTANHLLKQQWDKIINTPSANEESTGIKYE